MTMSNTENVFNTFLESNPATAFNLGVEQFGPTGNQRNFFQNQFQNILDQFLGVLGGQSVANPDVAPNALFTDFLQGQTVNPGQTPFSFGNTFASTAPSLRGGPSTSLFRPPARSLFF